MLSSSVRFSLSLCLSSLSRHCPGKVAVTPFEEYGSTLPADPRSNARRLVPCEADIHGDTHTRWSAQRSAGPGFRGNSHKVYGGSVPNRGSPGPEGRHSSGVDVGESLAAELD